MSGQQDLRSSRASARRLRPQPKPAANRPPVPEPNPAYEFLSLDDIRALRRGLSDEETKISYWRRLVQARIDIVRAQARGEPIDRLAGVLTDVSASRRRVAALSVESAEEVPELPELLPLWQRVVDPWDSDAIDGLIADLRQAEDALSDFRSDLHRRMDEATGQLIVRLREDPTLALTALPSRA